MKSLTEKEIVKVCYLYYIDNRTQEEISSLMQINRVKISRVLKEARSKGIVSVSINAPTAKLTETEVSLSKTFGLKEAIVVKVDDISGRSAYSQVADAAAEYLHRIILNYQTVSIAWGRTLRHVIEKVKVLGDDKLRVVQLAGGAGIGDGFDSNMLAAMLSQKVKGKTSYVNAPLVVKDRRIRNSFLNEPKIRESLDIAAKADLALLSVGPISKKGYLYTSGLMAEDDYNLLQKAGGVGAICGRCFDINGNPCTTDWEDRVVGLTLENLKQIKHKVGISFGPEKIAPLLGALRGRFFDVLITDEETSRGLLKTQELSASDEKEKE